MAVGTSRRFFQASLAFLLAAAALVVAPGNVPPAHAINLLVDPGQACGAGGPVYCTIAQGVAAANPGTDAVQIADGTYVENVTVGIGVTIEAVNQGGVTIDGGGLGAVFTITGAAVTLDGLRITNGSNASGAGVSISGGSGVTISDSQIFGNSAAGAGSRGGGVFISGSALVLDRSSVTGNVAERGGGIYVDSTGVPGLIVRDTTIDGNTSTLEGGAIYLLSGTAAISNATVTGNSASSGTAYFAGGSATFFNTVVAGNTSASPNPACDGGGSVTSLGYNFISRVGPGCASVFTAPGDITGTVADPLDPRLGPLQDNGGVGLSRVPQSDSPLLDAGNNGVVTTLDQLGNSRIVDGVADAVAQADIGAVELDPLTVCVAGCDFTTIGAAIGAASNGDVVRLAGDTFNEPGLVVNADLQIQGDGSASTIVDAGGLNRVLFVTGTATVAIRDLTMQNGQAPSFTGGGGISTSGDLLIERSRILNSDASTGASTGDLGGGIFQSGGTLVLRDSEVSGNSASWLGGGIAVRGYANATTTDIVRSTIANNSVTTGGGGIAAESGDGIVSVTSTLNIVNSTITGNTVSSASLDGGGLYTFAYTPAELDVYISNSTISANSAGGGNGGGGILAKSQVNMAVANSIIAGNFGSPGPDCNSQSPLSFVSLGHNVVGNGGNCPQFVNGVTGDQVGTALTPLDPQLGALADNGGYTPTMLPAALSPAVDNGSLLPVGSGNAACLINDQRGVSRPDGPQCDVGAVEGFAPPVAGTLQGLIDVAPAGGTVNVPPGTYVENITIGKDITLLPDTPGTVTIDGGGSGTTVDVTSASSVFMSDLTITNGGSGGLTIGSDSDVTLTHVDVTGNTSASAGGGIYNFGTLNMFGGSISNNTTNAATAGGLWNGDTATLDGVTLSGNDAGSGDGGAAYNAGLLNIINGTVLAGNTANAGAAIYNNSVLNVTASIFTDNSATSGGALFNGSGSVITLMDTDFTDNFATQAGGAIYNDNADVDITGGEFLRNHVGTFGSGGAIDSSNGGVLATDGTDFTRNGGWRGGAMYLLDDTAIVGGVFAGNVAGYRADESGRGGGIAAGDGESGQALDITGTDFVNNAAARSFTAPTVDQDNLPSAAPSAAGCDPFDGSIFQGFVPSVGQLDFVRVRVITPSVGPGGLTMGMKIRDGGPQGTVLAAFDGYLPGAAAPGTVTFQVNLPVSLDLTVGNLYVIEVYDLGGASWFQDPANPYGAAQSWVACGGAGTPLSQPGIDYDFETGSATTDGTWDGGAIAVSTGTTTISGGTYTANLASDAGGAVYSGNSNTDISGATFEGNAAESAGGAVYISGDADLSANTYTQNTSGVSGGAVATVFGTVNVADSTFDTNSSKRGGGLAGFGEVNITGSTFVGNSADALGPPAAGGAIFLSGGGAVANSTVSGNDATAGGATGGGIVVDVEEITINNATIVGNGADIGAGGISAPGGLALISNSIIANNTGAIFGVNCSGVISLGNNVLGDLSCSAVGSDVIVVDPLIGALVDNGGLTETHSPLAGSPAIDAGNTPLDYQVFNGTTLLDWQRNGSAVGDAGELLLAGGVSNVGSAFVTDPISTDRDFAAQFDFQIVPDVSGAADGITFSLSDDPAALGAGGGFLGIGTAPGIGAFEGVSVEFDTWVNGAAEGANDGLAADPFNHIGIDLDGDLSSVAFGDPAGNLGDGSVWTAWVEYDAATTTLDVYVSNTGSKPGSPTVTTIVNLSDFTGGTAYAGFTGASGGATIAGQQRILNFALTEASSCAPADQRGIVRPQGADCDAGAVELDVIPEFTFGLSSALVVPSGASTIKTTQLPAELATRPTDPLDVTDDNIASAPIANLDTQSTALESSPIANLPIANLDVAGSPIANLPIANLGAAADAVVDAILLVDIPLAGGWDVHLALSATLAGRPIQSITLGEVLDDTAVMTSLANAGLTLNDMNVQSSPIANLTIAGLALGSLPIANLPLDGSTDNVQAWCAVLSGGPVECSDLGIVPPNGNGYSVAGLSIAGADISAAPIANLPIANLPIANLPIANLPIANLVLADSPIANLPIANLPIANLPIANLPIANLPIANLPIANLPIANLPIANLQVDGTPIANLPIANLPIANLAVNGLPIANLPIANLPIANLPIANIPIANLVVCPNGVFDCNNPGDTTVGQLYLAGLLTGNVIDWIQFLTIDDLETWGVVTGGAGVVDFDILFAGMNLSELLNAAGFGSFGEITLSELSDFLGMTLGELLIAMVDAGLGNDFFLGDVLLMLVNPEDYPWEDLELEGVNLQEFDLGGGNTTFVAEIEVTSGVGAPASVQVDLPAGWLLRGVNVADDGGALINFSFSQTGQSVFVNLASIGAGTTTVNVSAAASLTLGATSASSTANVGGVVLSASSVVRVSEVLEPNNTPETATDAEEDTLYLTHIATEGDIDMYEIQNVVPGSRISVILSDMSADFDLVLYQPELPPLRPGGVTPEGIAPGVSDPGGFTDGDDQIQHEVTGDFPRAFFAATGEQLDIYETSTQAGTSDEVITTATLQAAGTYYVQVHGNNGATAPDPYALRVEVIEPPSFLSCSPNPRPFTGTTGAVYTAGPGPYNTLILFNESRFGEAYGSGAATDLRAALEDLAGQNALGVNAILVPVDGVASVDAAYGAWDADRCNPLKANAVAAEIGQVVDDYRAANPSIAYVTIVGDDGQIPFFRVPDRTEIANESEYALSVSETNNELVGSLLAGFMLTDDPFGDAHPLLVDGRELYISDVALGRLVESPADILQSIGDFSTFNGRLDPGTASTGLSTGYDFIEDAAIGIQAALDLDPRRTTSTLNTDTSVWTSQNLSDEINLRSANVLSLGAHMAHDGLLSAAEDLAGTQADLYTTADAQSQTAGIFENSIVFSMGCHSGLNVSAIQVGQPAPDWAETFNQLGAVYAAETGFGYGDTEYLAYGEELMRQFAGRLNGSMTSGQAMQFAKHFHAANLSQYSTYDEKVIMETVMYGLPFYAVGDATAPPPAPPILPSSIDPATGLTVVPTSFDFVVGGTPSDSGTFEQGSTPRGDFFTADGEAQVTPFNPIQPKGSVDVTQPGLVGTGVFIEELTSRDIPGFDPVFSRPTVDLAANEPERSLPGTFPLVLPGINAYLDAGGNRDQLVVVLGQFTDTDGRGLVGVERLFTHVKANVLYGDPADTTLPTIESVKALDNGTFLTFNVKAYDLTAANDVARVYVLYKLRGVDGAWSQLDLTDVGNRWAGTVPSPGASVEYIVQAVDFSGLVAVHSNKTAGNIALDVPAPQPGGIDIQVTGTQGQPGVYTADPVTIEIIGIPEGTPVNVDVDGGGFEPYTAPFQVSGEGGHIVTVDGGPGGPPETVVFIIDTMGPEVFINSPADGHVYRTGSPLIADFGCTDAGVGTTSCIGSLDGNPLLDGATIDTSIQGTYTVSVSSTDGLSRTGFATATFEVADSINLCEVAVATITGSASRDVIYGTSGDDVIFALGGNDVIFGAGGNDIICAGGGNDSVFAGTGNDYVEGGQGNDKLWGGSDDDTLVGGDGNDRLYGELGDDLMVGGLGNDNMWGAFGIDTISYAEAAGPVSIDLGTTKVYGEGNDRAYLIENAIGSEFDDTILGSIFGNVLVGLGGNDEIRGKAGPDFAYGGRGDDSLYGDGGADFLDGGPGVDSANGGSGQDSCANAETVISC